MKPQSLVGGQTEDRDSGQASWGIPGGRRNVSGEIIKSLGEEIKRPGDLSALEPNPRLCDQKTNKQTFPPGFSNLLSGTNVSSL